MKENKIELPSIYTKEKWEQGGKNPSHKKYIGKQYVSWSQVETKNSNSGFNTGLKGFYEYIRNKLSKETYPDMGWGLFGHAVEAYITIKDSENPPKEDKEHLDWADKNISEKGKEVLKGIKPLGVYQREICLYVQELDIIVLGYIDDMSEPTKDGVIKKVRDYKTKSESSKKDLHLYKKHQLEIYVMYLIQEGYTVEECEYVIIERTGGYECFKGGGAECLDVGERVWVEEYPRALDVKRQEQTMALIVETVKDISEHYKMYNKIVND